MRRRHPYRHLTAAAAVCVLLVVAVAPAAAHAPHLGLTVAYTVVSLWVISLPVAA
jgi:hypothetical protein